MKFEDFGKIGKKHTGPGVPIEGTFGCQYCDDVLLEAMLHPTENLITWNCPSGHLSSMEWKV